MVRMPKKSPKHTASSAGMRHGHGIASHIRTTKLGWRSSGCHPRWHSSFSHPARLVRFRVSMIQAGPTSLTGSRPSCLSFIAILSGIASPFMPGTRGRSVRLWLVGGGKSRVWWYWCTNPTQRSKQCTAVQLHFWKKYFCLQAYLPDLLKTPLNFVHQNLEIEMIRSRREYAHRDQRGRYVGASQEKN